MSGKLFQRQSASMTAPASKTAIPAGNIHRRPRVAGQELGVPGILLLAVPQAADHLSLLGVVAAIERAAAAEVQPYLRDVQDTLLLVDEEVAAGPARTQARPPGGDPQPGSAQGKRVLSRDGRVVRFGSHG